MNLARPFRSAVLCLTIAGAAATAGCSDTPTSPSLTVAFSQTDIRAGTGLTAAAGNAITVHYTGWLYDPDRPEGKGGQFETSVGSTPFTFTLGIGQVIPGWDQGLTGMQEGGLRRLVIPSSLAYGSTRSGVIPPNATLLFEVELVTVVQ